MMRMGLRRQSDCYGDCRNRENGEGQTDCWIVHDNQNVSVPCEFVQYRGEL